MNKHHIKRERDALATPDQLVLLSGYLCDFDCKQVNSSSVYFQCHWPISFVGSCTSTVEELLQPAIAIKRSCIAEKVAGTTLTRFYKNIFSLIYTKLEIKIFDWLKVIVRFETAN